MYLDFPDQAKSLTKFNPKMQNLNIFWIWPVSREKDLFDWLLDLKNFVLSNGSENVQNVIHMP